MTGSLSHTDLEHLRRARALAQEIALRSHAPFSRRQEAALLLLSDGAWIPGVRVESASFSLTIPALLNAVTTAAAGRRSDIRAVVTSRPILPEEHLAMQSAPLDRLSQVAPDAYTLPEDRFPGPEHEWDPRLHHEAPRNPMEGVLLARIAAENAFVPESDFPVGCVLRTSGGDLIPGVNVEHTDWNRVLCAERNALGTAVSYGFDEPKAIYLSCLHDSRGTPCGACRQLLSELAPGSTLWMDRGEEPPESTDPLTLLPGSFTGTSIPRKP